LTTFDNHQFNEISEGIYYDEINSESLLAQTISNALSEVELTAITTELEMVTSVDILTKRPLQLFCTRSMNNGKLDDLSSKGNHNRCEKYTSDKITNET